MKPGKCLDRIIRMKAIEKEFRVAIAARDALSKRLVGEPSALTDKGLERVDFDQFSDNLDATYLIRLFAEFESGLRDYWKYHLKRKAGARVSGLIQSIGPDRKIDFQEVENVEEVRRYRNKLVHEGDSTAVPVEVGGGRRSLCIFFGRLPEAW